MIQTTNLRFGLSGEDITGNSGDITIDDLQRAATPGDMVSQSQIDQMAAGNYSGTAPSKVPYLTYGLIGAVAVFLLLPKGRR